MNPGPGSGDLLSVEVAYALPAEQLILKVNLPPGATVEQAIRASGLLERVPEIDLSVNKVGVFAKLVPLDTPVQSGDRVEVYRPLIADPKEVRRARAAKKKAEPA